MALYKIARINKDGFREEIYYIGPRKNIPKGWTICLDRR